MKEKQRNGKKEQDKAKTTGRKRLKLQETKKSSECRATIGSQDTNPSDFKVKEHEMF